MTKLKGTILVNLLKIKENTAHFTIFLTKATRGQKQEKICLCSCGNLKYRPFFICLFPILNVLY